MSKRPNTLRLRNVVLNSFTSNVSNAPKEFSWTPKMSFSEMPSQPRMLFKNSISAYLLKQLQGFTHTHRMRNLYKQMYMVGLYIKFINLKLVLRRNFSQYLFAKDFKLFKFKRILSVFAFSHKVKCILSDSMPKIADFHFFISCAKFFKNTTHAKLYSSACANFGAHFLYYLKNLRRFSLPCAEAQGILCM